MTLGHFPIACWLFVDLPAVRTPQQSLHSSKSETPAIPSHLAIGTSLKSATACGELKRLCYVVVADYINRVDKWFGVDKR